MSCSIEEISQNIKNYIPNNPHSVKELRGKNGFELTKILGKDKANINPCFFDVIWMEEKNAKISKDFDHYIVRYINWYGNLKNGNVLEMSIRNPITDHVTYYRKTFILKSFSGAEAFPFEKDDEMSKISREYCETKNECFDKDSQSSLELVAKMNEILLQ